MVIRREFLKQSLLFSAAIASGIKFISMPAYAGGKHWDRTLVLLELKGGNDGLNTLVPYTDEEYYNLRPTLGIKRDNIIPISDKIGNARLKFSLLPAVKTLMFPLSALCWPPVTGASKTFAPFDSINFDNLIISFLSVVLISIHKWFLFKYLEIVLITFLSCNNNSINESEEKQITVSNSNKSVIQKKGGKPQDRYSCVINTSGYCIFTGNPHQTGLKPKSNEIIDKEGNYLFSLEEACLLYTSDAADE